MKDRNGKEQRASDEKSPPCAGKADVQMGQPGREARETYSESKEWQQEPRRVGFHHR